MGKVALPFVGMVMAECAQVGLIILSKQVMSKGMSNLIFIFYSNTLAAIVLLPFSLLVHRSERPPITISALCGFFILGILGYLAQAFGYAGIYYSSATLSTAMLNLVPGFTFVLAVAFRMERLDWRNSSSLAKSLGTIVSIAGAFVVTLYKGPALLKAFSPVNLSGLQVNSPESNWVLGGIFLAIDCVMASAFIIVQASVLKKYPAELIVVFFYCFFVAILSALTCLFLKKESSAWSLEPTTRLLAVLYSGVFGSAFQVGVIFLGDAFYLGSLIGASVIVVGFYSVLWGKANDIEDANLESSNEKTPLLT
ncbi:hypothetical protein L6164_020594 [Bauhinia variegata]|uniref:Uncharacterized protein n=1 Tax=Bauhinia variegata TaxID=167791 RepID=A0ACB9MW19_BAUVA|nr:hypothetical protein L6164_020594 [Bauhinia variegata]